MANLQRRTQLAGPRCGTPTTLPYSPRCRALLSSGRAPISLVQATLGHASVACTRLIGAWLSSACEAWAWRSQWALTAPGRPARQAARLTTRCTAVLSRWPPRLRELEHRRVRRGVAAQRRHRAPHRGWQQDRPGPAALAEDRQLPGVAAGLQVAPGEAAELGDAQPGRIEQAQHGRVARVGLAVEQPVHLLHGDDAFGAGVLGRRQADGGAGVERQIAEAVGEAEQALDCGEPALPAGGRQVGKAVHVGVQVAQGDGAERLGGERQEGAGLAAVGGEGARGASVQPERHQVGIAVGLLRDGRRRHDRRCHDRRRHCRDTCRLVHAATLPRAHPGCPDTARAPVARPSRVRERILRAIRVLSRKGRKARGKQGEIFGVLLSRVVVSPAGRPDHFHARDPSSMPERQNIHRALGRFVLAGVAPT